MNDTACHTAVTTKMSDRVVENAVDDIVWSRDCDDNAFRDLFIARFNSVPWYRELGSAYSTGVSYTGRICQHALSKAKEHGSIVTRLKYIQACLGEPEMSMSLNSLVVHHQTIANSYMTINAFYA